jgi:hypothetical protein
MAGPLATARSARRPQHPPRRCRLCRVRPQRGCHDRLSRKCAGKCFAISVRTSASVDSVITDGMTSGRGSGRDQSGRAISDAAPCRDQSSPEQAETLRAARQFPRTGYKLRMACRRHGRRRPSAGCCRAMGDRDGFRTPSRCRRRPSTPCPTIRRPTALLRIPRRAELRACKKVELFHHQPEVRKAE